MRRFMMILAVVVLVFAAVDVRADEEEQLIAILQSDAGAAAKCQACQRLRVCGTENSVAVLGSLLGTERVGHAARYALESMPYESAGAALRDALGGTSGAIRAGIVDSIGWRRDEKAVPLLAELLESDAMTASATAAALGRIGNDEAAAALKSAVGGSSAKVESAAADALLLCAEARASGGDETGALEIYEYLLGEAVAARVRGAAWRGRVMLDEEERPGLIVNALTGEDEALRKVALKAVREVRDEKVIAECLERWDSLGAEGQLAVLDAHVRYGAGAVSTVRLAIESSFATVRIEAWRQLSDLGTTSLIAAAVKAAAGDAEESGAARDALLKMSGDGVLEGLLAHASEALAAEKVLILEVLGEHGDESAADALLEFAESEEGAVRIAALDSLGDLAVAGTLRPLLDIAGKAQSEGERAAATRALTAVYRANEDRQRAGERIVAAYRGLERSSRGDYLGLLREVGSAAAFAEVKKAAESGDEELSREALRVLGEWPNAAPADYLLEKARSGRGNEKILALRGYVDIVAKVDADESQKVEMYETAMRAAGRDAEKKKVLGALSSMASVAAMQMAAEYVGDGGISQEAAFAATAIGERVYGNDPGAVRRAMEKVAESDAVEPTKERARKLIAAIDAVKDLITNWEVSGPYVQEGKNCSELFDVEFAPEKNGGRAKWVKMPLYADSPYAGYLDLLRFLDGGDLRVAYLRTNIESAADKGVTLEIFSDDGVKAWLNGEVVHANNCMRPIPAEPDRVRVRLKKGENRLMLKITQNNMPWGAIVRIRDGA